MILKFNNQWNTTLKEQSNSYSHKKTIALYIEARELMQINNSCKWEGSGTKGQKPGDKKARSKNGKRGKREF